jgi:hypothetical protein
MQLLLRAVVSIMGRRNLFKAFIPSNPPPDYLRPANGHAKMTEWTKPVIVDPAATTDVDKAKKRLSITANYSVGTDDHFVGVDTTGGSVTLTLPTRAATSEGKIYIIKDEGGWAATHSIIIQTADNAKIDNLNSVALVSNYGAVSIYFNATDWHIY